MFRRALKAISPAPVRARQRLKEAIVARESAQLALAKAREVTARVQAVIDNEKTAANYAEDARWAAAEAAQRWAANGADPDAVADRDRLSAIAIEAKAAASKALDLAKGAMQGIDKVKEAEYAAAQTLEYHESAIREIIGAVLLEELRPTLVLLEKSARLFKAARYDVEAALGILNAHSRFADMHYRSTEATDAIVPILEQAQKDVLHAEGYVENREDLRPRREYWRDRANALRVNPNE